MLRSQKGIGTVWLVTTEVSITCVNCKSSGKSQSVPNPLLSTTFRRVFRLSRMICHFTPRFGEDSLTQSYWVNCSASLEERKPP